MYFCPGHRYAKVKHFITKLKMNGLIRFRSRTPRCTLDSESDSDDEGRSRSSSPKKKKKKAARKRSASPKKGSKKRCSSKEMKVSYEDLIRFDFWDELPSMTAEVFRSWIPHITDVNNIGPEGRSILHLVARRDEHEAQELAMLLVNML